MKKLIAIAVLFAIVAGAAFAETAVSGNITTRARLFEVGFGNDSNGDPKKPTIYGEVETAYVQVSGQNDDGTYGGLARIRSNDGTGKYHRAFAWWQPIPQLRVFLGQDPDGKFGSDQLVSWPHHQGQEDWAHHHNWGNWRNVFPGNWDKFGLAFTVKPAQGVELNLTVPMGGFGQDSTAWSGGTNINGLRSWEGTYGNRLLEDVLFGSLQLSTNFAIPDIGKIFFVIRGPGWDSDGNVRGGSSIFAEDYGKAKGENFGYTGLSFLVTAVEGLQAQLGAAMTIPDSDGGEYPFNLGLAAHYVSGDFGIKFRSRFVFGAGSPASFNKDAVVIDADIMPWYNLGVLRAFLNIGFSVTDSGAANTDPVAALWVNPYIRVPLSGGEIRLGVWIEDPNLDVDDNATLKVPVMFTFSF